MSRSNPTIENPCQRWFEWSGSKGQVYYYDKPTQENVFVDLPFRFLMLDTLTTIKGFSERDQVGIYSNEVRSLDRILRVKTFDGRLIAEGKYENIKDSIKANGGKFAKSTYVAYKVGDELQLGNIVFMGASLGPWIDLEKQFGRSTLEQKAVVIIGSEDRQNGGIEFKSPTFKLKDVSKESNEKAIALDRELQKYLKNKVDVDLPEEQSEASDIGNSLYGDPQEEPPMPQEPVGVTDLNENYPEDISQDLPF